MKTKEQKNMDVIVVEGQTIYLDPNVEGAMKKLEEANKWGLGPIVKESDVEAVGEKEKTPLKRSRAAVRKTKSN